MTPGNKIITISRGATSCNDTANQIGRCDVCGLAGRIGQHQWRQRHRKPQLDLASGIANKPDVMVGFALPSEVVGSSLAEARDAGILTVSIADTAPHGWAQKYVAPVRLPIAVRRADRVRGNR